jgi:hypothetical protein
MRFSWHGFAWTLAFLALLLCALPMFFAAKSMIQHRNQKTNQVMQALESKP